MDENVNRKISPMFQKLDKYESEEDDIRFQSVKIWLMHLQENLNGSYFSREVVENALPTLANTPILAYIEKNNCGEVDFSDHRDVLVKKNGEVTTKYLGKAIGTIPETNNAKFEDRLCDDGVTRTFVTVEGLLWTKFDDPIDIMNRDFIKAQSMELADDYEGEFGDDGLFHFSKFSFFGACGLGFGIQPAMQNATIELQFSLDNFQLEVNRNMEIYKNLFAKNNKLQDESQKPVHFEDKNNKQAKEDGKVKSKKEIAISFKLTAAQLFDEFDRVLGEVTFEGENWWGETVERSRYYLRDYDENFAYAVDCMKDFIDIKIPYSMDGDNLVLDYASASRIKYAPVDWENGSVDPGATDGDDMGSMMSEFAKKIVSEAKEKIANMEAEFTKEKDEFIKEKDHFTSELSAKDTVISEKEDAILALNDKFQVIEEESKAKDATIETLSQFKKQREAEERKEKVEALFAKFSKHLSKEEMDEFRNRESEFESYELFEKEIKSFTCDRVIASVKDGKSEFSNMALVDNQQTEVKPEEKPKSVWDRL